MGVDSLPPHGLHQLLIRSVDNYHFESQIVIWATSLLFVPETPAHFIRWAVIHLGLSVEGGILAAITRTSILLREGVNEKKTFSFGHCLNHLKNPTPDPNLGNLVLFFPDVKIQDLKIT